MLYKTWYTISILLIPPVIVLLIIIIIRFLHNVVINMVAGVKIRDPVEFFIALITRGVKSDRFNWGHGIWDY